jgi:hypothetical protein
MTDATTPLEVRGRPMTNLELATSLGACSTALGEMLTLHVKTFGTLIPHVFMSRVLDHVRASVTADPRPEDIVAILESLETGLESGDRETRTAISMSFLSEAEREPFYVTILPLLGPRVRAHFTLR